MPPGPPSCGRSARARRQVPKGRSGRRGERGGAPSRQPDLAGPRRGRPGHPGVGALPAFQAADPRGSLGGSVTLRTRVCWPGERPASYYPTRVKNGAMRCIECDTADVSERRERTTRGYRRFRCRACGKQFNERSGGILNRAQYPSDVIALVIFWRLRYKLSLRDLPGMFLIRGIEFSYEAVRDWEAKLTPSLIDNLRRRRKGRMGKSWYVDETYIKVNRRWWRWCTCRKAGDPAPALSRYAMTRRRRTDFGRPAASIRLRTATPMAASVCRAAKPRARSRGPISAL
jgi:transposase-like protein